MKKEKSGFAKFLGVLGIILLVIVIFAAALFLSFKLQKLTLDDPAHYSSMASTGSADHLSFTPDADMTISFDKSDIWYFITQKYGDGFLDEIKENINPYGLDLKNVGFEISDGEIRADAEAYYKGWLRIPVRVYAGASCEDDEILITPIKVKVGPLSLPLSKIISLADSFDDSLCYIYGPELTFLKSISDVSLKNGKLNITGPMATAFFTPDTAIWGRSGVLAVFTESGNLIGPVLLDKCSDQKVTFSSILPRVIEEPSLYTDLLTQYFTIDDPVLKKYETKNEGMLLRWYPEFSYDSFDKARPAAYDDYYLAYRTLQSISDFMYKAHDHRNFRIKDGELTYKNAAYNPEICFGDSYSAYSEVFNLDASAICFMKKEIGNFPLLSSIADSDKNLSFNAEMDSMCSIGLFKKGADGRDYAIIFPDSEKWNFYPMDDIQYSSQIFYPADPSFL